MPVNDHFRELSLVSSSLNELKFLGGGTGNFVPKIYVELIGPSNFSTVLAGTLGLIPHLVGKTHVSHDVDVSPQFGPDQPLSGKAKGQSREMT